MAKILNIILFVLSTTFIYSNAKAQNEVYTDAITTDKYGNIYAIGSFEGAIKKDKFILGSSGQTDIYIAKYNKNGTCQWIINAGGSNSDEGTGITVDKDGYVYATGTFTDTASFDYITFKTKGVNSFVAKYNQSGDIIWVKKASSASANDINIDGSNNVYITGSFSSSAFFEKEMIQSVGETDIFIAKYLPNGKIDWVRRAGGKDQDVAVAMDIIPGSITITGYFKHAATFNEKTINGIGGSDIFIANYTTAGTINWATASGNPGIDIGYDVAFNKKNEIISCAQTSAKFPIESSINIRSINGDDIAKKTFEGISFPCAITTDEEENIYTTGSFKNELNFGNNKTAKSVEAFDIYISKMNKKGDVEWTLNTGYNKDDSGKDICIDNEGNIITSGEFFGVATFGKTNLETSGSRAIYLAKINPKGEIIWVQKCLATEPNFDSDYKSKYKNIYAKLLTGENEKISLSNQKVNLKNLSGDVLQSTLTDLYGDFSFKSVEANTQVNIELESNSEITDKTVYIANQSGNIITKLMKDKNNNFIYTVLPQDYSTLSVLPDADVPSLKIKDLKKSTETEVIITQNIFFESGSTLVNKEEEKKIAEIAKLLRANPTYFIEVIAYTDADGDDDVNLKLSEKRAKAVADLIATKGVKPDKITSKGLGETKILNRCTNGIECSDKEKMMNRRTEFKISKISSIPQTNKKNGK